METATAQALGVHSEVGRLRTVMVHRPDVARAPFSLQLPRAPNAHGADTARTIGLTTLALCNLLLSLTVRDHRRSTFSLDTFDDRKFLLASGLSFVAIVIGSQTDVLNRLLKTVPLTMNEWLLCLCVSASVVLVSELRKLWLRRQEAAGAP